MDQQILFPKSCISLGQLLLPPSVHACCRSELYRSIASMPRLEGNAQVARQQADGDKLQPNFCVAHTCSSVSCDSVPCIAVPLKRTAQRSSSRRTKASEKASETCKTMVILALCRQ
eukprot:scaffold1052_cov237-Pinguiococcus_pyrenoidosus.AAC.3